MNDERWTLVDRLLGEALERPPHERQAFLREACGGDDALRLDVESLVTHASSGADVLRTPAVALLDDIRSAGTSMMGRHVGPYALAARLGAGGMGEVYRARDTKLGRDVAIKILPRVFATDPDRRARLDREARLLAALNHPHIGAIYGLEALDGTPALILELVDGDTLAERIAKGPVPLTEALRIARQIADALDAAHEKGIVHRDLKPANIKITPDGLVKVLDFGLAKAAGGDGSGPDLTQSPTVSIGGTHDGVILGTAPYMSPEQARGKAIDKRTDVWAFGCVFFEMLTGRVAFAGDTVSDTIAAILEREPEWSALPATTPGPVRWLLLRCLAKDAKRRLRDIGDVRTEIDDVLSGAATLASPATAIARAPPADARAAVRWLPWAIAAAGVTLGAVSGLRLLNLSEPRPPDQVQFEIRPPAGGRFVSHAETIPMAWSPDGSRIAYAATDSKGQDQLWLRIMSDRESKLIRLTEGTNTLAPFWSPDGDSIGFFAGGQLKRLNLETGGIVPLCKVIASQGFFGTWGRDTILFGSIEGGKISEVSIGAGPCTVLVSPDADAGEHRLHAPWFLPGGERFLYSARLLDGTGRVMLSEPGKKPRSILTLSAGVSSVQYADPGFLVYETDGKLVARRFDLDAGQTIGDEVPIVEHVRNNDIGSALFAVSRSGALAYQSHADQSHLAWYDQSGAETGKVEPVGELGAVRISPDDRSVMFVRDGALRSADLRRPGSSSERVNSDRDKRRVFSTVWHPFERRLFFAGSSMGSSPQLFSKEMVDEKITQILTDGPYRIPEDVSPDNRLLLYAERDNKLKTLDLWTLSLSGDPNPSPWRQTLSNENAGRFSPDQGLLAYVSDELESGVREVWVAGFPAGEAKRLSYGGGSLPRWSRSKDKLELFYISNSGALVVVPVRMGSSLEVGAATPLFVPKGLGWADFDVSGDGRFLAAVRDSLGNQQPLAVDTNWTTELLKSRGRH